MIESVLYECTSSYITDKKIGVEMSKEDSYYFSNFLSEWRCLLYLIF